MGQIIVTDKNGQSRGFEPTPEGYRQAERYASSLGNNLWQEQSDVERILDVTQPSHHDTGIILGWF